MWQDSSLILSGTGSIFLPHANLLKCSTFSAVRVLISVLQLTPLPYCYSRWGNNLCESSSSHIFALGSPMLLTQGISSVLHCCGKISDIIQGREGLCSYSPSWLQELETVRQQEETNDTAQLACSFSFGSGSQPIGATARA